VVLNVGAVGISAADRISGGEDLLRKLIVDLF
jgi:hypothetical protein